ncbi:MAG: DUF3108 domain-containing protein [Rhodocyclaceae bacterium]|nr:DUF3108 domain-containing protein [Rhodocyclaceae bacterium]
MYRPPPARPPGRARGAIRRRLILLTLGLSLLLHAAVLVMPGWQLPESDTDAMPPLHAGLQAAPATAASPRAQRPKPPPARPRRAPQPTPAPIAAQPGAETGEPAETQAAAPDTSPATEQNAGAEQPVQTQAEPTPDKIDPAATEPITSDLPVEGRISFAVSRGDGHSDIAESVHGWQHDGTDYVVKSRVAGLGLFALAGSITLESRGKLTSRGLQPEHFEGRKRRNPTETVQFDRSAGLLRLSGRDQTRELELPPDTQDLASVWYQLGWQHESEFSLWVCNGRSLTQRRFRSAGEENFDSRVGPLRVLHLVSDAAPGEDAYDVWLALAHHRLPVRIRQTNRKGEVYDQQIKEMQYPGTHLAEAPGERPALSN